MNHLSTPITCSRELRSIISQDLLDLLYFRTTLTYNPLKPLKGMSSKPLQKGHKTNTLETYQKPDEPVF